MTGKRQILMTPHAAVQVAAIKDRPSPGARKTYTDRLAELQRMADTLAEEIQVADADVGKRLTWLREYAKILPLLERAERRHQIVIDKRSVDDMTDAELRKAVKDLQALDNRKAV
jgi:hypothetical protein